MRIITTPAVIRHRDLGSLQKSFIGLSESESMMVEQWELVAGMAARTAAEGSHILNHSHKVEIANWKRQEF